MQNRHQNSWLVAAIIMGLLSLILPWYIESHRVRDFFNSDEHTYRYSFVYPQQIYFFIGIHSWLIAVIAVIHNTCRLSANWCFIEHSKLRDQIFAGLNFSLLGYLWYTCLFYTVSVLFGIGFYFVNFAVLLPAYYCVAEVIQAYLIKRKAILQNRKIPEPKPDFNWTNKFPETPAIQE